MQADVCYLPCTKASEVKFPSTKDKIRLTLQRNDWQKLGSFERGRGWGGGGAWIAGHRAGYNSRKETILLYRNLFFIASWAQWGNSFLQEKFLILKGKLFPLFKNNCFFLGNSQKPDEKKTQ